jgi:hypothetical protein
MNEEIYRGKGGIKAVTWSLSQIDSASAKASKPQDEDRGAEGSFFRDFSRIFQDFFFPKVCLKHRVRCKKNQATS